jgi:deazaflavin-dependent oxidoreductase (nitroreductase family)
MADTEVTTWEDQLIEEMRANGGKVTQGPLAGHPLLILTSRGARSGQPRRAILTYTRDGDDLIVAGTAGGSPTTPSWVYNVEADSLVGVEADNKTFDATAQVIKRGSERDRLWEQHVAALPWFAPYPEQTGRVIPMVRLTRTRDLAREG